MVVTSKYMSGPKRTPWAIIIGLIQNMMPNKSRMSHGCICMVMKRKHKMVWEQILCRVHKIDEKTVAYLLDETLAIIYQDHHLVYY